MRRIALASVAALFAVSVPSAFAADMPVRKAAPVMVAPAYNWSGCYIGAQFGGASSRWTNFFSFTGLDPFTRETDVSASGAVAGGHVGCNLQRGQWVFGLEGDGEWSSLKGNDGGFGGDTNELSARWMASVRGRLGYSWNQALLYVTGGGAFMGARSSVLDPGEQEAVSRTLTGWTVGGGLEYGFTNNLSARVEYRYADFGNGAFRFPVNGYTERHTNITIHAVRGGITYRFTGYR